MNINKTFSHYLFAGLDKSQQDKLSSWFENLGNKLKINEEDCDCTMSGLTFSLKGYDSGLGPTIWVEVVVDGKIEVCNLGYDDDGELSP